MKTYYVTPSIEIIEIEIEDAVLQESGDPYSLEAVTYSGDAW